MLRVFPYSYSKNLNNLRFAAKVTQPKFLWKKIRSNKIMLNGKFDLNASMRLLTQFN